MRQKSESLKSDPVSSGLVQWGKKLADLEVFLFLLISHHKRIVTQPRPAWVRRAGSLPPLLPGSRIQPGPSRVIRWAESQIAGAYPWRSSLCNAPKAAFYQAFLAALDPGVRNLPSV